MTDADLEAIEARAKAAIRASASGEADDLAVELGRRIRSDLPALVDVPALVSALREARRLLRKCELAPFGGFARCPVCEVVVVAGSGERPPHTPGCALAEAIR